MSDPEITNCHVHTFTDRHVPWLFPHPLALPVRHVPGLARLATLGFFLIGQERLADVTERLIRFRETGATWRQADVLGEIARQYPAGTRFVVLPMDMAHAGWGRPAATLRAQHDELAALAAESEGRVIPFATVDPRARESVDEARRAIEVLGFRGLKIYPRLGFPPDHPALLEEIYPLLLERDLPVMSHCARGGVQGRGVTRALADRVTDPAAMLPVRDRHPGLRICLAHFGGEADWAQYLRDGLDPDDPEARRANWLCATRDLLRSEADEAGAGLWADISFTLFARPDWAPLLKVFLEDDGVRARTLFGSDFYMTRQVERSERAVSVSLRDALGEAWFREIAETNPRHWLGEA
ncbi:MAG: amidohydrolase family protein [Deinococcus-Thermus bacterium]|jgi:predicted TIM-barrel fold metal-dependent hydrolase|nr:amidohydrolase family protein [Deinococcota bacterium]